MKTKHMTTNALPKLSDMPQPPDGAVFSLRKVDKVTMPHPFMITPGHVAYVADHCGGILTTDAIKRSGVKCGWTMGKHPRGNLRCQLSIDQHETSVTLFISVSQNKDLNAVEGLGAYLSENKPKFEALGIQGFAFPATRKAI